MATNVNRKSPFGFGDKRAVICPRNHGPVGENTTVTLGNWLSLSRPFRRGVRKIPGPRHVWTADTSTTAYVEVGNVMLKFLLAVVLFSTDFTKVIAVILLPA